MEEETPVADVDKTVLVTSSLAVPAGIDKAPGVPDAFAIAELPLLELATLLACFEPPPPTAPMIPREILLATPATAVAAEFAEFAIEAAVADAV